MAYDDNDGSNVQPYIAALTTLNTRCTQDPLDIDTQDVLTAQTLLKQGGDSETNLSILQAIVKVSGAGVSPGYRKVDCQGIAEALTEGATGSTQ